MGRPVLLGGDLAYGLREWYQRNKGRPENVTPLTPRTRWPAWDTPQAQKLICCRKADGTYVYELGDNCQQGETKQPDNSNCRTAGGTYINCCLYSNGITVWVSGACPAGSIPVSPSQCSQPPVVCCINSTGATQLYQGACPAGWTQITISSCGSKMVCCKSFVNGVPTFTTTPNQCPPGSQQFPSSFCTDIPLQPTGPKPPPGGGGGGAGGVYSGSCSITVTGSTIYWNGFCVNGADTSSPYYQSPSSCNCSGGNLLAPTKTIASNVDALSFDTCDFRVDSGGAGCCNDNNTQSAIVSTVGPTGQFSFIDPNCRCWTVTVRHGLIKAWAPCDGGAGGMTGNCGSGPGSGAPAQGGAGGAVPGGVAGGNPPQNQPARPLKPFDGKVGMGALGFPTSF